MNGPLAPLSAWRQFIPVRLVASSSGTDKLPIDWRTGQITLKGSDGAHDPAIWLPHDQATFIAQQLGPGHGVGFVLTAADPFFCLDIDGARQGDAWSPLSLQLCAKLPGCVVEVSQSGQGLHVWGRASTIPEHRKRNTALAVELYSERRFIVLGSGQVGTMADNCAALPALIAEYFPPREGPGVIPANGPRPDWRGPTDDDDLIRRALQSRSAAAVFGTRASFADLWEACPDVLAGAYPSASGDAWDRSSADMALAQHLAFWTGCDAARIDRLMRRSALTRDKWEREDYLPETIENACGLQRDVLKDRERPTLDEVRSRFHDLDPAEVLGQFPAILSQISPTDRHALLDVVEYRTGVGRRELNALAKDYRTGQAAKHAEAELTQHAAGRQILEYRHGDVTAQALDVEAAIVASAAPGEFVQFGGALSRIVAKPLPYTHGAGAIDAPAPTVPRVEPLDDVAIRAHVERVALFTERQRSGIVKAIDVPESIIKTILNKQSHSAPAVTGLLTHPLVLPSGRIVSGQGLDAETGLFVQGVQVAGLGPYTREQAAQALQWLRASVLHGFEFASPLDADIALSAFFTAVERRAMTSGSPGFVIGSHVQSSGKTTLTNRMHLVNTGREVPAVTMPESEEELRKKLAAILMGSPEMVLIDNVPDGYTFRSPTLAAIMTSGVFEDRILGASRTIALPTNVLFTVTGNNLTLGADEVTRFLSCMLAPASARPQERTFSEQPQSYALRIRPDVLRAVVGIVAGSLADASSPGPLPGVRFKEWDKLVRRPLVWAGGHDVAEAFRANEAQSETLQAHASTLGHLARLFPGQWFGAGEVAAAAGMPGNTGLRAALEGLPTKDPGNARSVGRALRAAVGRVAMLEGGPLRLKGRHDKDAGSLVYRVEGA
jgi:hypothetical protein